MKENIGFLILIFGILLAAHNIYLQRIFDSHGRQIGRVDNGRFYDGQGSLIGRYDNDRLFNSHGKQIGRVNQERLYDGDGRLLGRVDENRLYDNHGRLVGRVNGNQLYDGHGRLIGRSDDLDQQEIILFFYFYWPGIHEKIKPYRVYKIEITPLVHGISQIIS